MDTRMRAELNYGNPKISSIRENLMTPFNLNIFKEVT